MKANRRNRSQMGARKRLKQADRQPVASDGNGAHGKEGVDCRSPKPDRNEPHPGTATEPSGVRTYFGSVSPALFAQLSHPCGSGRGTLAQAVPVVSGPLNRVWSYI
jgi:hypothetical protein